MNRTTKTYIGDNVDQCMGDCVWKNLWIGFIKTPGDRLNAVAITVETNVPEQIDWNLRVLQHTSGYEELVCMS